MVALVALLAGLLVISRGGPGGESVEVPTVLGQYEPWAREALTAAGFRVEVTTQPDLTRATGTVINQEPRGGDSAAKGRVVRLVVAVIPLPDPSSTIPGGPTVPGGAVDTTAPPPVPATTAAQATSPPST